MSSHGRGRPPTWTVQRKRWLEQLLALRSGHELSPSQYRFALARYGEGASAATVAEDLRVRASLYLESSSRA